MESLVRAKCFDEIFGVFPIELELKCSDFSDYFISFIAACAAASLAIGTLNDAPGPDAGVDYVLNTNSKKFHYLSCSSVDDMKESNKGYYTGSRDDLIASGYSHCGRYPP